MGTFLLAHIGIPVIAALSLVIFEAAASAEPISWNSCNPMGIDLVILSIGANGAIFLNENLIKHWENRTPVYGIVVVLINLTIAAFLVYRKRWNAGATEMREGLPDLILGALALSVTCGVFYFGYQ